MRDTPHVALLIETSREYGRGLLRGVARYQQEHGPWSVFFEPHGLDDPPPVWLKEWDGDGILARVNSEHMAEAILETGLPAVDIRGALPELSLPFIGVDNLPVAKLAYAHLRECGLQNFAFCGTPRGENPNQDLRCDYFVAQVEADGRKCSLWLGDNASRQLTTWEDTQQQIAEWLRSLTLPVGIMTCHDDRGLQVLDACRRANLKVPDEVAVIGVDNDPYLCNMSTPPLTSIDVNPSRIGYETARLLWKLMKGGKPRDKTVLLGPPRGIAPRRSTETLSIDDAGVAAAIHFIRENATKGILVNDVIAVAKQSPSTLERRFKSSLGRTIKAEITRVRLARAKLLLAETGLPVSKISNRCGFSEPKYFCEVFRKHETVTPTAYRKKFRDDWDN